MIREGLKQNPTNPIIINEEIVSLCKPFPRNIEYGRIRLSGVVSEEARLVKKLEEGRSLCVPIPPGPRASLAKVC